MARKRRARNPRNDKRRRRRKSTPPLPDEDSDFILTTDDEQPPEPRRKRQKRVLSSPLLWEILAEENEEWLDAREAEGTDSQDYSPVMAEVMEPSSDIVLPLLRFQKEWLAWAMKQEASEETRGGILADEMGMGKTIQAIALVVTSRSLVRSGGRDLPIPPTPPCSSSACPPAPLPRVKATLVVCPVVAVIQWAGEIERHTERGTVRVLVYHGPKRGTSGYDFNQYDFVLTTYSTIEGDYRRYVMPPKEPCEYCGKKFHSKKLKIHARYYCGPHARKTEKQAKQQKKKTKKKEKEVCGLTEEQLFCSQDEDDELAKKKTKKKKKEAKKMKEPEEPADDSARSATGKSMLHSVYWERIILDEAHYIKDRRSNTARGIFALESFYRWALSGTPLQNRVGELYSLVHFLRVYPYSYYFCKDCNCKVLDYGFTTNCIDCIHSTVRHFCWWNRYITKPIRRNSENEGTRAMILLKDKLLKSMVLRRTKKGRAADLALPPRQVTLRRDSLDRTEYEFYEALYTQSRVQFDTYALAGTLMNNFAHIFDLLTRLRQAVDHPYLVVYSKTAEISGEVTDDSITRSCGICHDPAEDMVVTSCDHVFCKACLINFSSTLGNISCPSCPKPLTVDLTTKDNGEIISGKVSKGYKNSGILKRIRVAHFKTSTKIDALREEIRDMVEADCSAKGIVFSQFTSFLDLINFSLQMSGIKCVQLVGSMSLAEREKAIQTFIDDGDCRIFLMSLKAGGVALNLPVASHVFLMDPWWNPAVECQAQDRIHRIGQFKPIRTVRFVIEDTIEERILKLQEKKKLIFEGTVGKSSEALAKLTQEDLSFLFQI